MVELFPSNQDYHREALYSGGFEWLSDCKEMPFLWCKYFWIYFENHGAWISTFSLHLCHGLLVEKAEYFRVVSAGRCKMFPGALGLISRACDIGMVSLMLPPSLDICHVYPRCCNEHLKIFVKPTSCKALVIERNPKSRQNLLKWAVILGEFLISEFWLYQKIGTATENSTI